MSLPQEHPSSRARLALVAALCLLLACLSGGVARADDASKSDPKDGAANHPDIKSLSHTHGGGDRFRHTITTYANFSKDDAPCLVISIRFPKSSQMRICGDGDVVRTSDDAFMGEATVDRPDKATVVYTFPPESIQGATTYQWHSVVRADACTDGKCDRAPNSGWIDHVLPITYEQWADGLLGQLEAPDCDNNHIVVIAWLANEGTAARYNPLATTYELPGSTDFNSTGVQNYASLSQGNKATRLTLKSGATTYGYGAIVKKLQACATPLNTAKAIRASDWCSGCSDGKYVMWLIEPVRSNYATYANRLISTL